MDVERAGCGCVQRRTVAVVPQEASGCSRPSSIRRGSNRGVCAQLEGIQEAKGQGRLDSHVARGFVCESRVRCPGAILRP